MNSIFKKLWINAGLKKEGCENPTQYSFRHYFAIRNILNWMNSNTNVDSMIPYLMRTMGTPHLIQPTIICISYLDTFQNLRVN